MLLNNVEYFDGTLLDNRFAYSMLGANRVSLYGNIISFKSPTNWYENSWNYCYEIPNIGNRVSLVLFEKCFLMDIANLFYILFKESKFLKIHTIEVINETLVLNGDRGINLTIKKYIDGVGIGGIFMDGDIIKDVVDFQELTNSVELIFEKITKQMFHESMNIL